MLEVLQELDVSLVLLNKPERCRFDSDAPLEELGFESGKPGLIYCIEWHRHRPFIALENEIAVRLSGASGDRSNLFELNLPLSECVLEAGSGSGNKVTAPRKHPMPEIPNHDCSNNETECEHHGTTSNREEPNQHPEGSSQPTPSSQALAIAEVPDSGVVRWCFVPRGTHSSH